MADAVCFLELMLFTLDGLRHAYGFSLFETEDIPAELSMDVKHPGGVTPSLPGNIIGSNPDKGGWGFLSESDCQSMSECLIGFPQVC